jgi:hypothetical protein
MLKHFVEQIVFVIDIASILKQNFDIYYHSYKEPTWSILYFAKFKASRLTTSLIPLGMSLILKVNRESPRTMHRLYFICSLSLCYMVLSLVYNRVKISSQNMYLSIVGR